MVWLASRLLLIFGLVAIAAALVLDPPEPGPILLRTGVGLALIAGGLVADRCQR